MSLPGATRERPSSGEVRAHYAELAGDYARGSNRACNEAYRGLVAGRLTGAKRVLEVGAGGADVLSSLAAPTRVACDLSPMMLRSGRESGRGSGEGGSSVRRVAGNAEGLPYPDAAFDGVFSINLLEHVSDPDAALREMARVLEPGGVAIAVTPNGDLERLLDLLEAIHMKLPEGPHAFLRVAEMRALLAKHFDVVEHETFLAFPAGPQWLVERIDNAVRALRGPGLFQYAVCRAR